MIRAIYLCRDKNAILRAYDDEARAFLQKEADLLPDTVVSVADCPWDLSGTEAIFSAWGMPSLSAEELDALPKLAVVFYAGGSVRSFAETLFARGIRITAAANANAIPVAEYCASQILLANKGFFRNCEDMKRNRPSPYTGKGNSGTTVALLGFGAVARRVRAFLRPCDLKILVYDPFLSPEEAARENVEKVGLSEAFSRADVVSCHLPLLPETRERVGREHFARMPRNAVFINTGRGATLRENEMIEVLQTRSDLLALLDVSSPEPAAADSPLRRLPNVRLTSHIAGSVGAEISRMGNWMVEEFLRYRAGEALRFEIKPEDLSRMA